MSQNKTPVEFKYRGFGEPSFWNGNYVRNINPNALVAIRIDDTWIPGDTTYLAAPLTSFWIELLKRIHELHQGSDSGILWMEEMLFSFERVSETVLRISSHASEAAITDQSQRIGIEASATVLFDVFVTAAIETAEEYLHRLEDAVPESTDEDIIHLFTERLQEVRDDCSELANMGKK
jgi:hypothetical protein